MFHLWRAANAPPEVLFPGSEPFNCDVLGSPKIPMTRDVKYIYLMRDERGLIEAFLADGRLPLSMTGFILLLSGWFAIFQSLTGYFLPQDIHALGFDARQLADMANIHVVHFMFHDRVAFGGTLLAVGGAYWFLAEFPLRARESWAWWTFLVSGICGFASFLTYLGYGYLDTWHGIATLFLLPLFAAGLWRARQRFRYKTCGSPANR